MPRIAGWQGTLSIGGSPIADIYDISIEINADVVEATCKGENFSVLVPGGGHGRLTAKRRINTSAILGGQVLNTSTSQTRVAFSASANALVSSTVVSGFGYISQGALAIPSDAVDDTIELMIDGADAITWSTPGSS